MQSFKSTLDKNAGERSRMRSFKSTRSQKKRTLEKSASKRSCSFTFLVRFNYLEIKPVLNLLVL